MSNKIEREREKKDLLLVFFLRDEGPKKRVISQPTLMRITCNELRERVESRVRES
jgi:delta-aminolevulinic acid dehydratase/porphobilinogen synthase